MLDRLACAFRDFSLHRRQPIDFPPEDNRIAQLALAIARSQSWLSPKTKGRPPSVMPCSYPAASQPPHLSPSWSNVFLAPPAGRWSPVALDPWCREIDHLFIKVVNSPDQAIHRCRARCRSSRRGSHRPPTRCGERGPRSHTPQAIPAPSDKKSRERTEKAPPPSADACSANQE